MIHEHFCGITEVRPGRTMFARCLLIGTTNMAEVSINLICVHGTMGACKQFDAVWEPLAQHLSSTSMAIWMFDTLGCGRTPVPPRGSYSASDFADDAIEADIHGLIVRKVDTAKPMVFVGHSYAPQTILKLVRDYPVIHKAAAGFVFCNTGFHGSHAALINGGPTIFKVLPIWLLSCLHPLMTQAFLKLGFSASTSREILETARNDSNSNDQNMTRHYCAAHIWLTPEEAQEIVQSVNATRTGPLPIVVLHGVEDQIFPITVGEATVKTLDVQPLVVVEKAGHQIYEEQPEVVAREIANLVLQHSLGSR
mmetsp:Transcript_22487/g.62758  ORF Transcript_22487/g.62758 Transcript_22487/m.62758 type:complete len:309 (-) Transcript_22487:151-1077(-)|eukprot:CAMPEP_0198125208 /NCGR_PEP_ID=MMETSP1442-20131203/42020_1 /TAXON_ID= /ORGANISM="Craspedostauros australis, Strain CCMP3328" /LENGTH=308 /DNA_ID=CAMNT_0043784773 /DNA_START=126 /DNA_END=1052 /DNA_ORIENTATION=+